MFQSYWSSDLTNVGLSLAMVDLPCFSCIVNQSLVCSALGYLSVSSSHPFPSSCPLSFTFIRTSTVSSRSTVARRPALVYSNALVSSSQNQHLFDRNLNRIRGLKTKIPLTWLLHHSTRRLDFLLYNFVSHGEAR